MGGKFIATYFFIPHAQRPPTDGELLHNLGADLPSGDFGPFTIANREIDVLSDHICAQLYFLDTELLNLVVTIKDPDQPVECDPALPFAIAIRKAAVAINADIAIL